MINLDFLCMKAAQQMVACKGSRQDKENVATKALGVLLENGPYGLMLYLQTQQTHPKAEISRHYQQELVAVCGQDLVASYLGGQVPRNGEFKQIVLWLTERAKDLDQYLFTKRLWQQVLTYARYHAKAEV